MQVYSTRYQSPIGEYILASDGKNLIGVWQEEQKYYMQGMPKDIIENDNMQIFDAAKHWLNRYFAKQKPAISELALAPQGSEFRQKVWNILCKIPYGETVTYGYIGSRIGCTSGQAVGGAVGHNPISIIIPCHRVVGSNGSLTGYAGGLETKRKLLNLER